MGEAADPLAPDETPGPGAAARRPSRGAARVIAALALVFLLAPGALLALGAASRPLARERAAPAPRPADGWAFFDDAELYLTQHLPLRRRAVAANTWISRHVFGTTPNYGNATLADRALPFGGVAGGHAGGYAQTGGARVGTLVAAVGRGGWLFLQGEITTLCHPPVEFGTAIARWRKFLRIVRASGRRVVLAVVPEKSTIYPERVRVATAPDFPCALRHKDELWRALERDGGPDLIPLRQGLLAARRADPSIPVYLPLDSHWNEVGALLAVRRALARVGAGVSVAPGEVRRGLRRYTGDIAAFGGGATTGTAPTRRVVRPGEAPVRLRASPGGALSVLPRQPGAPRVIPGVTLFLHDSFGDTMYPMLEHYSARLAIASFLALRPAQIVNLLRGSRTVIVETSERDFLKRAATGLPETVLSPAFLRALPAALR